MFPIRPLPRIGARETLTSPEIERYKQQFEQAGIIPPEEPKSKAGTLQKIFGLLARGETAPAMMAHIKGEDVGQAYMRSTFGAEPERRISYSDVFTELGWKPKDIVGKAAKFVSGLFFDIFADPKTYLTLGAGGALRLAGKGGTIALNKVGTKFVKKTITSYSKELSEGLVKEGVKITSKELYENSYKYAIRQLGAKIASGEGAKYLAKDGLKFMGKQIMSKEMLTAVPKGTEKIFRNLPKLPFFREHKTLGAFAKAPIATYDIFGEAFISPIVREIKRLPFVGNDAADMFTFYPKAIKAQERQVIETIGKKAQKIYKFGKGKELDNLINSTASKEANRIQAKYLKSFLKNKQREAIASFADDIVMQAKQFNPDAAKLIQKINPKKFTSPDDYSKAIEKILKSKGYQDIMEKAVDPWIKLAKQTAEQLKIEKATEQIKSGLHAVYEKKIAEKLRNRPIGEVMTELVEKGEKTGIDEIDNVLLLVSKRMKTIGGIEMKEKILKGTIDDKYIRRILTKEAREQLLEGKNIFSGMSKPLRVSLGAAKERKFVRMVSEFGDDITFKKVNIVGFEKINKVKILDSLEKQATKKTKQLQTFIEKLSKKDVDVKLKPLKETIEELRKQLPSYKPITEGITETFSKKEYDEVLEAILKPQRNVLKTKIEELENLLKLSGGDEFLYRPIVQAKRVPYQKKIIKAMEEIRKVQSEVGERMKKFEFFDYISKEGNFYKSVSGKEKFKGFKQLTTKEINEWSTKNLGFKMFEEDIFKAWAVRETEHIRAIRTYDWLLEASDKFGRELKPTIKEITTVKGLKEKIYEYPEKTIDGIKHITSKAPQLEGVYFPEAISKQIDEAYKAFTNDNVLNDFFKGYDKALRYWKGSVTGWFPAFHTRNFMGGNWNNFLEGVRPGKWLKTTNKVLHGEKGEITTALGKKMTFKEIRKEYLLRGGGQTGMIDVVREMDELLDAGKIKRKFLDAPKWAMEGVENRLRLPLFIDRLVKGDTADEAMKRVFRSHFDYAPEAMTAFEGKVMKRLMPFYRWFRGNAPYQLANVMKQPGKYAALAKTQREFNKLCPESEEEQKYMPEWMSEMFFFRLPGKEISLYLQLDLPIDDLNKLPLSMSGVREIFSLMSPALKYPIEIIANKNIYFGSAIKDEGLPPELQTRKTFKDMEKISPNIMNWLEYKKGVKKNYRTGEFEPYYEMDAVKLHTLRTFLGRFYSSFDQALKEDMPIWGKMSRLIGGVPIREFDITEEKYRKEKAYERLLRETSTYLKQREIMEYK